MPRLYCDAPLAHGERLALPAGAARHVQVLRMQPGQALTLFDGRGGQWQATICHMGRSEVQVDVGAHEDLEREANTAIHLALGMPANERMDWLLEKATELGAASFTPLVCERSVLRLAGERAARKQAHWQAVVVAACEQSGRNRVPPVHAPVALADWLAGGAQAQAPALSAGTRRLLLSLADDTQPLPAVASHAPWVLLSGPEGGLTPHEESLARAAGFEPITLGARVLRTETAPLAALARLAS